MNNKGQTLVIFVILLPIILMIFTLIIDLGFLHIEKRKIENNVSDSVEYCLNNIEKINLYDEVKKMLNRNIDDIDDINIVENDEYIEITVSKMQKSLYSIISNNTEINITYRGIKSSNKIIKG